MVVVVEPSEVENVHMGWVYTVCDDTTGEDSLAVSTPENDEHTTQIMVPMDMEMNHI